MIKLHVDPVRKDGGSTGIFVHAVDVDGRQRPVDIAELDRPSLMSFLRSRGGDNRWAEDVVLHLLGHEPES